MPERSKAPDVLLHAHHTSPLPTGVFEQSVTLQDPDTRQELPFERLIYHAPGGLAYGYGGSGPSDLALNILALHLPLEEGEPQTEEELRALLGIGEAAAFWEDEERSTALFSEFERRKKALPVKVSNGFVRKEVWEHYQDFKWEVIAPLDQGQSHVISSAAVQAWLRKRGLTPAPASPNPH